MNPKEVARERLIKANELPNLPDAWEVERFRFLFTESKERNGDTPVGEMLSVSEYRGVVPKTYESEEQKRTEEELQNYKVVRPGQLAVNSMWLNHLGLGVSEHTGHISPAYASYNISQKLNKRYVHHLMRSNYYLNIYMRYLYGIRPNSFQIKSDDWMSIPIIVPPTETQKEIADFLDRETSRIDQLIEKKEKLLQVLDERIQSICEFSTSHGFDSNQSVPVVPLRRALKKIEQGWSPDCENRTIEGNEWGVLKVGCVNGWEFNSNEHKTLPPKIEPKAHLEIKLGDVLMSRANSRELVGSIAVVNNVKPHLMLCDKLYRLYFDQKLISISYAIMVMRSKSARRHYEEQSNGASSSMQNIGQETVKSLKIKLPSIEVQEKIEGEFYSESKKTEILKNQIRLSILKLDYFKTSLITEAVTGQLDIKAWKKKGGADKRLDTIEEAMAS